MTETIHFNGPKVVGFTMGDDVTHQQIIEMLAVWQKRLGLSEWTIAVTWSDDNPEVDGHACHMKVTRSQFYKRATLDIGPTAISFTNLPDCIEKDVIANGIYTHLEYVEISIVHELLHLSLRDLMRATELAEQELHPSVRSIVGEAQQQAEEGIVEQLAQALVRTWKLDH